MNPLRSLQQVLRALWREPGYVLAFVVTLGLGIGANTAIFSLINGVLLRPLPYPAAERLVYLEQPATQRGRDNVSFSFAEVADYRERASSLEEVVEYGDWTFNVLERGEPHRAVAGLVTANFFEVLGMRAQVGRLLAPEDRLEGAPPVVVLSHEYWQRLGGDQGIVGEILDLTIKRAEIVGVLAPGAHYATQRKLDFYANYASNDHYSGATMEDDRTHRMTDVFARLAPGRKLEEARAELGHIAAALHQEYPDAYPESWGFTVEVTPWKEELVRRARPTLLLLLGAAAFVLVIACANVANLTLARTLRRERELAVRTAMGAGALRLRARLFGESLVLAVLGAGLGVVLAGALHEALVAYTARFTPRTGEIGIDARVLLFTLGVAVATSVAFALVPGLVPTRRLASALSAAGGRATASGIRRLIQRSLVVGQIAVTFVLLVGAGLLVRTLYNLHAVDPGFELENVLSLEAPTFTQPTPEERQQFADRAIEEISAHAGVASAAMTQSTPLGGSSAFPLTIKLDGEPEDPDAPALPTVFETVSPSYFETLGVEIVRGRAFAPSDRADALKVAILNQSAARHYFRDGEALGRRIAYSFGNQYSEEHTVVGIAADTRPTQIDQEGVHALYLPAAQSFAPSTVLVRTAGDPSPVTPLIVETLRNLDPQRPIEHVQTLAELRAESLAPQRLNATLFGAFAGLALLIATIGVAAVIAFSVSARRREMGIRATFGASPGQLLAAVMRDGLWMTGIGLLVGAAAAAASSRLLAGLLFEVEPLDATTFVLVGVALLLVASVASMVPARRASSAQPVEVLRSE
jgi:predicted permease